MLVVHIQDWLDDNGNIPLKPAAIRRNAIRVAQLIEYGGPLEVGQTRETLVPCSRRPGRKLCPGMLWVAKEPDDRIYAYCITCQKDEVVISGWQETLWADGMMEPVALPWHDQVDEAQATRH